MSNRPTESEAEQKPRPWYVELMMIVIAVVLIIFVVHTFIGRIYLIPSGSMEPTLHGCEGCTGDRIATEKITYAFTDPEPGDVAVFAGTGSWNADYDSSRSGNAVVHGLQDFGTLLGLIPPDENNLVKRIIATGGQTVSCQPADPGIMVDGEKVDDSYTLQPPQNEVAGINASDECGGPHFGPVTVPEDHYFMMGDNRTDSADSRYHLGDEHQGTIPEKNIRGKAKAVIFPFTHLSGIEDPDIQL